MSNNFTSITKQLYEGADAAEILKTAVQSLGTSLLPLGMLMRKNTILRLKEIGSMKLARTEAGKLKMSHDAAAVSSAKLGVAMAAVAAAMVVVSVANQAAQSRIEEFKKAIEETNTALEENKANLEENKALTEQLELYQKINHQYELGLTTRENWIDTIHTTIEAIDDENLKLLEQVEAYDLIIDRLNKLNNEQKQENYTDAADYTFGSKQKWYDASEANWNTFTGIFTDNTGTQARRQLRAKGDNTTAIISGGNYLNDTEIEMMRAINDLNLNSIKGTGNGIAINTATLTDEEQGAFLKFLADAEKTHAFGDATSTTIWKNLKT